MRLVSFVKLLVWLTSLLDFKIENQNRTDLIWFSSA